MAKAADQSSVPDGVRLPNEIKRREDRLAAITVAKAKIAAQAKKRYEQEHAEHAAKLAARVTNRAPLEPANRGLMEPVKGVEFPVSDG